MTPISKDELISKQSEFIGGLIEERRRDKRRIAELEQRLAAYEDDIQIHRGQIVITGRKPIIYIDEKGAIIL